MTDLDRLERMLTEQLAEVGASARPPADAWERFARRAGSVADHRHPISLMHGSNPINDQQPQGGTEIRMRSNDVLPSRRRWPVIGVAAGLIAVAIVGVALAARDTDDPDPPVVTEPAVTPTTSPTSPSIELRGAEGNPEAVEAFDTVTAAFEAFNAGDGPTDGDENERGYVAAAHAAGARYDVSHCDYDGLIEREPGLSRLGTVPAVAGHQFTCVATMTDAFTTAAGIDFEEESTWLVADGIVIDAVSSYDSRTVLRTFMRNFGSWLEATYPEVGFPITANRLHFYHYPVAADVPLALEYVDEFVAADDRWPISSDGE